MIRTENLEFMYSDQSEVLFHLKDADIEIEKGEFVAIIGHNGSGKSTMAKLINGILMPSEGVIYVDGMDTKDGELIWEIRRTAGMVFQNPDNQIVATIVEDDVAFGPENLGIHKDEIRERVDRALTTVKMYDHRMKPPHLLSGGQKQRIAIAGILAMRPQCIVLDEPTAMLDPSGRKEVMETVERLHKEEGITILHITHFMEEAIHADRIIVMDHGEKVLTGTPREVFSDVEKMLQMGLDVPQTTLLAHQLKLKGYDIDTEILTEEELVNAICQLKLKD